MSNKQLQKSVFIIFRMLAMEANRTPQYEMGKVYDIFANLVNEEEKALMRRLVVAVLIITKGKQEVLRDPEKFSNVHAQSLTKLSGPRLRAAHAIGLDMSRNVTKEDYEDAKRLLPVFGSISISPEDLASFISSRQRQTNLASSYDATQYSDMVYRGMNNLSANAIKYLIGLDQWNITRAVSTSTAKNLSREFLPNNHREGDIEYKGPFSILMHIKTENSGLSVGRLSYFQGEHEVVLSGHLRIDNFNLVYEMNDSSARPLTETDPEKIKEIVDTVESEMTLWPTNRTYNTDYFILNVYFTHIPSEQPDEI